MMKKQGYDDTEDESLGERDGKESGKKQSMKGRRDEMRGEKDKGAKKSSDADKALDDYDAAAQDASLAEMGDVPMAKQPLTPARVNALAQTAVMAIEELSDGQVDVGEAPTINEPAESLPPQLYQMVTAFAQLPEMVGMEQYAFDPAEESVTDDGLLRMANKIDQMSKDKKVKNAMMGPAQPQEEVVGEEITVGPDEISEEEIAAMI